MDQENKKEITHDDDGIVWDKGEATYGHKLVEIKRKDQPDHDHLEKSGNVNEALKNAQLSSEEDLANRNEKENKGIGR